MIAGSYSLTITDSYDCDTTILITLLEPSLALSVQAEAIQSISCFEDSTGIARALVVGGQSPYSYAWSGGHALIPLGVFGLPITMLLLQMHEDVVRVVA